MSARKSMAAVCRSPRCIVVTGPSASAKVRWLQRIIRETLFARRTERCALLTSDETGAAMERFAEAEPRMFVRRIELSCLCCPGRTDLARALRDFAEECAADLILVELPLLAAATQIAEFDALWTNPRELVVCLDDAWATARRAESLSFFQFRLLGAADRVIDFDEADAFGNRPALSNASPQKRTCRRYLQRPISSPCP